jgi:glyoxylase-like metal-dependent hydrolase (beta-lactamase superfamily II)
VIRLSDRVALVRAPNPSPMTLEGTNTYLVGDREALLLIDPGPSSEEHLASVRAAVGDARVVAVLITHRHYDHAQAARAFAGAFDAQVAGYGAPDEIVDVPIADGARVGGDGVFLTAVYTPGHAADHLCFVLEEERALFSGDHVLGRGTTVITWPDGDMAAYLEGLRRLQTVAPERIYPGHGPVLDDPKPVLAWYLEHRLDRERQIVDALRAGQGTVQDLVERVYTDVDPSLHRIAQMSLRAHLAKLADEGLAREDRRRQWHLT